MKQYLEQNFGGKIHTKFTKCRVVIYSVIKLDRIALCLPLCTCGSFFFLALTFIFSLSLSILFSFPFSISLSFPFSVHVQPLSLFLSIFFSLSFFFTVRLHVSVYEFVFLRVFLRLCVWVHEYACGFACYICKFEFILLYVCMCNSVFLCFYVYTYEVETK